MKFLLFIYILIFINWLIMSTTSYRTPIFPRYLISVQRTFFFFTVRKSIYWLQHDTFMPFIFLRQFKSLQYPYGSLITHNSCMLTTYSHVLLSSHQLAAIRDIQHHYSASNCFRTLFGMTDQLSLLPPTVHPLVRVLAI